MALKRRWHDRTVEMPLLWFVGVCGLLLANISWLPASVHGVGVLTAWVCLPWLLAKDIRRTWNKWSNR